MKILKLLHFHHFIPNIFVVVSKSCIPSQILFNFFINNFFPEIFLKFI